MKFIAFAVALFCAVAYVTAEFGEEQLLETYNPVRFRREANPQGSVVIKGEKPLSGPDRRPSLDVDYQQRVFDKNGLNANAYGAWMFAQDNLLNLMWALMPSVGSRMVSSVDSVKFNVALVEDLRLPSV